MENRITARAKEVKERYGISPSTLWLWVRQGKIKAHKASPRVTLFDLREIEEFLLGKEVMK